MRWQAWPELCAKGIAIIMQQKSINKSESISEDNIGNNFRMSQEILKVNSSR
jgi:hypothetical protein